MAGPTTRLVERGHDVTVYGRSNNVRYPHNIYRGVRLAILPTIGTKHLDTVAHTFLSVLHAVSKGFDCMLICNAANALFGIVPRITRTPFALNVDGIERLRKKWGPIARGYYRLSERLATIIPNAIITDAGVIRDYYQREYGTASRMIAYGAECKRAETSIVLDQLGVQPRDYFLYVSRLEPENNAHIVIDAFQKVSTDKKLLVVGDAPYAQKYIEGLKATRDTRIRFPGAIYGIGYRELQSHAYAYIQATEVGGTHPALIEAMGVGNCVIAKDTPENHEVLADAGLFFSSAEDLARQIQLTLADESLVARLRAGAQSRAQAHYSWDAVTDAYERLFKDLTSR